jgi:hypothetical protein
VGDIHVKLDDSWFERWKNCSKFRGQRATLLQSLIKRLIVVLEGQEELPLKIDISLKKGE